MPEIEKKEEIVDPVVLAAMIEDPDEDDEDKKLREEVLGETTTVAPPKTDDDDEEDEDEDDPDKAKKPKTKGEASLNDDEDDEEDDPKVDPKKPLEAKDDEDEDDDKVTRKEKRQKRQDAFWDGVLKDKPSRSKKAEIPNYTPLNYEDGEREFKPEELSEDREMVGAINFAKGAETAKYWAEQDGFWKDLGTEAKILSYDPKLSFLSEETPDGKKNDNFDPDKAGEINEMYLQLCGHKRFPRTDENGRPIINPYTGLPAEMHTVERTDISYEKFARRYVDNMKNWSNEEVETRVDENRKNIVKQKKNQGIRPGGGTRKSLGALNHGDITSMDDEEFEKNEAEIDRQILNML